MGYYGCGIYLFFVVWDSRDVGPLSFSCSSTENNVEVLAPALPSRIEHCPARTHSLTHSHICHR